MENSELEWVKRYAQRLNHSEGNLSELNEEERKHLKLLIQKYELENKLSKLEDDLSQGKLPLEE